MLRPVNPFSAYTTRLKSEKVGTGINKSPLEKKTIAVMERFLPKQKKNSPKR